MNNHTAFRALLFSLLALAVAAGIAFTAYNFGVQHAALEGGKILTAPPPGTQYVYVRPWGFGFGFFPLFFILFFFLLFRGMFWRRHWHHCYAPDRGPRTEDRGRDEDDPDRR